VSDNCPACLHTEERPNPPYERPVVAYRCSACGHTWTVAYDPDAYQITDDTPPRHWTAA
jgi:transposase-like protein